MLSVAAAEADGRPCNVQVLKYAPDKECPATFSQDDAGELSHAPDEQVGVERSILDRDVEG